MLNCLKFSLLLSSTDQVEIFSRSRPCSRLLFKTPYPRSSIESSATAVTRRSRPRAEQDEGLTRRERQRNLFPSKLAPSISLPTCITGLIDLIGELILSALPYQLGTFVTTDNGTPNYIVIHSNWGGFLYPCLTIKWSNT